jgi:hypothetical protein
MRGIAGSIEEDHVGVGISCARGITVEYVQVADWGKHALPQSLASRRPMSANVSAAHIEAVYPSEVV